MALTSNITTLYTSDQPRVFTARYAMDAEDRRYVDEQILGTQRHLTDSLIRGQIGSNFLVANTSPTLQPGDLFCAVGEEAVEFPRHLATRKVTKATPLALAAAGLVLGVATTLGTPGSWVHGAMEGIVGRSVTGLATGAAGYVRAGANGRAERVVGLTSGDYPIGYVDGFGNLSLSRERSAGAGGGGSGGYATVLDEGVAQVQRTTINFVGPGVVVTDVGGVTQIAVSSSSGPTGIATGQTQIWNGSAWTAGALDLNDADAVTGQLPLANLASGSATSVLGRAPGTSGVMAPIAATADGQVLMRVGGALAWGMGLGEYRTVATIVARNAIPAGQRTDGMLVYVQALQVVYQLAADLTTWVFFDASPALSQQLVWEVNPDTGNDDNDGKLAGTALASMTELANRLNPRGSVLIMTNDVTVNVDCNTTFTLRRARLRATTSTATGMVAVNYRLQIIGGYVASAPISLASVTAANAPTVRSRLTTAAGTFVDDKMILVTSGTATGCVSYCSGLNGSAQDAFFGEFVPTDNVGFHTPKLPAASDVCVVVDLKVRFFQCELEGSNGAWIETKFVQIQRFQGEGALNTPSLDGGGNVLYSACELVSTNGTGGQSSANGVSLFGCRVVPGGRTALSGTGWLLWGCAVQGTLILAGGDARSYGQVIDGGQIIVGGTEEGVTGTNPSQWTFNGSYNGNGALEVVNGPVASPSYGTSGEAVAISSGSSVFISGVAWGLSTNYAQGLRLEAGAWLYVTKLAAVTSITDLLKIPSTVNVRLPGYDLSWADLPFVHSSRNCGVCLNDTVVSHEENYVKRTAQTGNIGTTTLLATPHPGRYIASAYEAVTAPGTSGAVTVNLNYTDAGGTPRSVAIVTGASITGVGGAGGGPITFETNGAPITYSVTGIVTPGALAYTVEIGCRRITAFPGFYGSNAPIGTAGGQTQVWNGTTWVAGPLDVADSDAVTGQLPHANVASLPGLSVFGRALATLGVMAAITGAADQVLAVNTAGTALAFGQVQTGGYANGSITPAKLANATASSVFGRSPATGGVYADIVSSADGQVLRRGASGVIAWGAVDLSDADAVTGSLPLANLPSAAGLTVLGRFTSTSGVMAPIAGTANQILRVDAGGTTLAFGTITGASIDVNTIPVNRLATSTGAPSVLGRFAGTNGSFAEISAIADGQVLVRAGGAIGWGALDLSDSDGVTGQLPFANFANGAATSVFARAGATAGVMASLAATVDGQVLQRAGGALTWATIAPAGITGGTAVGQVLRNTTGNIPAWGALDLADTDAVTGLLPFGNLANLSALSVLGRFTNTAGVMAAITGTADQVLAVNSGGTVLGFGQVQTGGYANGSVTLAKLANGTASSVLGRSPANGGAYADILSSADGQVLRRGAAGVIGFGAVDLSDADAITGALPHANLASLAGLSVFGRSPGTAGAMAAITAATTGHVLRYNGAVLDFGVVTNSSFNDDSITLARLSFANGCSVVGRATNTLGALANITSSADGQVLRRAGGVVGWGAVDLADTDAVTGRLPLGNMTNGTTGRVLVAGASDPVWSASIGNNSDAFVYNAASHDWYVAGSRKMLMTASQTELFQQFLRFDAAIVGPRSIGINTTTVAAAVGQTFGVFGQNSHGAGGTGGAMDFRAGESLTGAGGAFTIASGEGVTDGQLALAVGATNVLIANPTSTTLAFGGDSVFSATASVTALAITGGTMLQLGDLSGARILGFCGSFSAANMLANTGDGVAFWKHAVTRPTTGKSVGGGIVWNDLLYGFSYKSDFGVETTIASTAAVLASKRRVIDFKTPLDEVTTLSTGLNTITSFNALNFNGQAFTNGLITARLKGWVFGLQNYPSYCELVATVRVTGGVATLVDYRPGFDSSLGNGVIGNGITSLDIVIAGGALVVFRCAVFFASLKVVGYFEVHAAED